MNIKKYCKQPKLLAKARLKYPCISGIVILLIFSGLLLSNHNLAAKNAAPSKNSHIEARLV